MNDDILKGKWKEIKDEIKKQWGDLTDDELMEIDGEKDKLVGTIQKKYGYSKEKAEDEYKSFMDRH